MNAGQRFSDSEWSHVFKSRQFSGLWRLPGVLFGIAAWLVLICIENFYLIIDWLIVALYIHCELLKSTNLFIYFIYLFNWIY